MAQPGEEVDTEDLADQAPADDRLRPERRDLEAPEADAAEQATEAVPGLHDLPISRGLEVDEADAYEQSRVVEEDDDYR